MRIVSLVPSVTETLSTWDRTPVGCTRFCERDDLAHVGGTKDPDLDVIAALGPDLVIVDVEENRREDYDALIERGLEVHALRIRSIEDVVTELTALATRLDVHWIPPEVPEPAPRRRRAFVPIWRRPWIALGTPTYGASLLGVLGVETVHAALGPYPTTTLAETAALEPDVVLAPSEPYPFSERQRRELESVAPLTLVDGQDLFWWGARTELALARLSVVLSDL